METTNTESFEGLRQGLHLGYMRDSAGKRSGLGVKKLGVQVLSAKGSGCL